MTDATVIEFAVPNVPADAYRTPLPPGHRFHYGGAARQIVPDGDRLAALARAAASIASGLTLDLAAPWRTWWVVTLTDPLDPDAVDPETGAVETLGDHNEGAEPGHWTVLLALNDLPPEAGADFRLVTERGGEQVGPSYPHRRGRGVMFRSQHFHGNDPLLIPHDRVSLAMIAEAVT